MEAYGKEVPKLSDEVITSEADRILERAKQDGVILRVLGALAFRYHCPKYGFLSSLMERKLTDIDFAGYSAHRSRVEKLLRDLGYITHSYLQLAAATHGRSVFWKADLKELKIDIFWDALRMNHDIDFAGRLELDEPTIPLPELLLEKMQIVKINWKDVKDVVMLLREHELGSSDNGKEAINAAYIASVLAKDWGFHYTFNRNVETIRREIGNLKGLTEEDKVAVVKRLTDLVGIVEKAEKTLSWRIRAKIGPRRIWYREVEDFV